jgi:fatty acid amide hydrolase
MFTSALEDAEIKDKQLQDILSQKKDPSKHLGKLHGIPFSIKDHIWVEGTLSTIGLSSYSDNVVNKDDYIIKVYRGEGAIPLVKGNVPIACQSYHADNLVWGCAKNPWDTTRTCGGSSGGDCALLASKLIPFAIGSDMLGSLRVPALFNGVTSLFPSPKRVYGRRTTNYFIDQTMNQEIVNFVIGPMARNTDDMIHLYKLYFSDRLFKQYPLYPKVPYNENVNCKFEQSEEQPYASSTKLKIGIINCESICGNSPAVDRAIEITAQILEDNDHEVIQFDTSENLEEHSNAMVACLMQPILKDNYINWLKQKDTMPVMWYFLFAILKIPNFMNDYL